MSVDRTAPRAPARGARASSTASPSTEPAQAAPSTKAAPSKEAASSTKAASSSAAHAKAAPSTTSAATSPRVAGATAKQALDARLAQLNLRLVDARFYLSRALDAAPIAKTSAVVEQRAGAAARSLAAGGDAAQIARALVDDVVRDGGLVALASLPRALQAHVDAVGTDLAQPGFGAALVEATAAAALAQLPPAHGVDRRAAMRSMVAASATLNGAQTAGSSYLSKRDRSYAFAFDCWTNEPGLDATLGAIARRGDAAVGVSGALLDVAAKTKASLVVSTDSNPEIQDFFLLAAAVLLVVDEAAEKGGWDDARRGDEVRLRLAAPSFRTQRPHTDPDALAAEVKAMGFPAELHEHLSPLIAAVRRPRQEMKTWIDDDQGIAHLTQLARSGKLVATNTDVADPAMAGRLQSLLAAHGEHLGALHVSNAFDYIVDAEAVLGGFGALPRRPDAIVTSSTDLGKKALLGSFEAPRAAPAGEWLTGARAAYFVASRFAPDPSLPARLNTPAQATWERALSDIAGKRPPPMPGVSEAPADLPAFRVASAAYETWYFADDDRARGRVAELALASVPTHRESLEPFRAAVQDAARKAPAPRSMNEAVAAARAALARPFTPAVRAAYVAETCRPPHHDPARLDARAIANARTFSQLDDAVRDALLSWDERRAAEAAT